MKRLLCVLLMTAVLVCTGCAPQNESVPAGAETSETEVLLEEFLAEVQILESPVREYGESYGFSMMDGPLLARILYPVGEIETMNQAVENWIEEIRDWYLADAEEFASEESPAELTVEYESRILDEIVSVRMTGIYDAPFMAHPVDIVKTFNGSLETGEMLTLEDITGDDGLTALQTRVADDADVTEVELNPEMLKHWALTSEGIEITLARGEYLPMSEGTKILQYTYEELEGILHPQVEPEKETAQDEPDTDPEPAVPEPETDPLPDPDKPMLALTFDDGPSAHTDRLLDAFKEHGGKGTFFTVGNMLDDRPDTVIRMAAEGHEIAGHSWNHRQLTSLGEDDLKKQLMNTRAKIFDIAGVDATLMRPPYGSSNDAVAAACKEYGIAMVNWSVDTLDWKYRDADYVYKSVMEQARDGAIILCHDLHGTTVDAMEKAIPALLDQGYQLVTVSQLLTSQGGEIEAGKMYYKR